MKNKLLGAACAIATAGCVFGATTSPPPAYRGPFVFTVSGAIIYECSLAPGFSGEARKGTCLNAHPSCTDCGFVVQQGTRLTILNLHDGVDRETASLRVGNGPSARLVDQANWAELKTIVAPLQDK